jgi:hypothetical protein
MRSAIFSLALTLAGATRAEEPVRQPLMAQPDPSRADSASPLRPSPRFVPSVRPWQDGAPSARLMADPPSPLPLRVAAEFLGGTAGAAVGALPLALAVASCLDGFTGKCLGPGGGWLSSFGLASLTAMALLIPAGAGVAFRAFERGDVAPEAYAFAFLGSAISVALESVAVARGATPNLLFLLPPLLASVLGLELGQRFDVAPAVASGSVGVGVQLRL